MTNEDVKLINDLHKAAIYGDFSIAARITMLLEIEKNLWLSGTNEPLRVLLNAFVEELKEKEERLNNERSAEE